MNLELSSMHRTGTYEDKNERQSALRKVKVYVGNQSKFKAQIRRC